MAQANSIRALVTGVTSKPSTNAVRASYSIADLAGHPTLSISLLEDRTDHLGKVLTGLSAYLSADISGGIDQDPLFSELASDETGTLQRAAQRVAARRVA